MLNRPDVIQGVARVDDRGGRRGARDRHLPGLAPEAGGVGARRAHARDQPPRGGAGAGRGRRRPLRSRLDRPHRPPARQRRPDARQDHVRRAGRGLHRAGPRPRGRRRRPDHHRDRAGHPGGQGRRVRGARGLQADRPHGADPDERLAAAQRRQDAARHRHPGRADHAAGAGRRRDRAQLLDRPGGHARRDPLPGRVQPGAGALHPQRGPAAPGARGRDDLPRGARPAREHPSGVRGALWRLDRRRLLRHHAGPHRRDRRPCRRRQGRAAARRGARRWCRA